MAAIPILNMDIEAAIDLVEKIEAGGFPLLLAFLQADDSAESWNLVIVPRDTHNLRSSVEALSKITEAKGLLNDVLRLGLLFRFTTTPGIAELMEKFSKGVDRPVHYRGIWAGDVWFDDIVVLKAASRSARAA